MGRRPRRPRPRSAQGAGPKSEPLAELTAESTPAAGREPKPSTTDLRNVVLQPMRTVQVPLPLELFERLRGLEEYRAEFIDGERRARTYGVARIIREIVERHVDDYEASL